MTVGQLEPGSEEIVVRNLTKTYGPKTAVDGITFTVEPGRVTGFLGPNGAGKSTTMRMILGLDLDRLTPGGIAQDDDLVGARCV